MAEQFDGNPRRAGCAESVAEFVYECANTGCAETLPLTHDEYRTIRSSPIRFAVVPGHLRSDVESVVEATDRYGIVEKHGSAADAAARYHRRPDE